MTGTVTIDPGEPIERSRELGESTIIGRSPRADIKLDDSSVSQLHAQVVLRRGTYYLSDQNSTNGTKLNGIVITEPAALESGDVIAMGNSRLIFRQDREDSQQAIIIDDTPEDAGAIVARVDSSNPIAGLLSQPDTPSREVELLRKRLEVLYKVAAGTTTASDETQLMETVLAELFEALPSAERGVFLIQEADNALVPLVSRDRLGHEAKVPVSRTILQIATESRRGILSLDPVKDERFADSETVLDLNLATVICVPLIFADHVHGMLQLVGSREAEPFVKEDLELAVGISGQVALSLAHRRLQARVVEQELLQKDLQLARRVQQHFLPESPPLYPPFDFELHYEPALEVGGDYYGFLDLPGERLGVAVGDVSGKGVSAALYMAKVSSEVRFVASRRHDPGDILRQLNEVLCRISSEGMFMTMVIVTLDGASCSFASAGHLSPILRRASGEIEVLRHQPGLALGVESAANYSTTQFHLDADDCLLLMTDGVVEAQSPAGGFFGEYRLMELIRLSPPACSPIVEAIRSAVKEFEGENPAADDLTIVAVGRPG
jgi:serine phosphatase RsbU (regulator of sigma subunit)/pSer/pThr/pTyr-binding forkhead associated (FHA) protein